MKPMTEKKLFHGDASLGVSQASNPAKRNGFRPRIVLKDEIIQQIQEEFSRGKPPNEIARDRGLPTWKVCTICKGVKPKPSQKAGKKVILRSSRPEKEMRNERIKKAFAEGGEVGVIAAREDLTTGRIYQICRGIERKTKPKRGRKKDPESAIETETKKEMSADEKALAELSEYYQRKETEWDRLKARCDRLASTIEGETSELAAKVKQIKRDNKKEEEKPGKELKESETQDVNTDQTKPSGRGRKRNPEIEKRIAEIKRRYENGETQGAIADDYRISRSTVQRICNTEWGWLKSVGEHPGTIRARETHKRVKEMFQRGMAPGDIARELRESILNVCAICHNLSRRNTTGENPGRRGRLKDSEIAERNERLREERAEGKPVPKIAEDEGLSIKHVYYICRTGKKDQKVNEESPSQDEGDREDDVGRHEVEAPQSHELASQRRVARRNKRMKKDYSEGIAIEEIARRERINIGYAEIICTENNPYLKGNEPGQDEEGEQQNEQIDIHSLPNKGSHRNKRIRRNHEKGIPLEQIAKVEKLSLEFVRSVCENKSFQ